MLVRRAGGIDQQREQARGFSRPVNPVSPGDVHLSRAILGGMTNHGRRMGMARPLFFVQRTLDTAGAQTGHSDCRR
jgi:hypothetical protein